MPPQITPKDIIKLGQREAGEAPTGEWSHVEPDSNDYDRHVLAKIWEIVRDGEDLDYDTNNLYDMIRDGVQAKKRDMAAHGASITDSPFWGMEDRARRLLEAERERCATIADRYIINAPSGDNGIMTAEAIAREIRSGQ